MKKNLVLIEIMLLLSLLNVARAKPKIWYVHPDSSLNSIQAALDSCADNDIVLVGAGIYTENIVWPNTQGIHLISELGIDTTIIDGCSNGSVITINNGVDSTTIIKGFTIKNGRSGYGGGICCSNNSSPFITDNIIASNRALDGDGGGIFCIDGRPIITNNIIFDNSGAGIFCRFSSATIKKNTIYWNIAEDGGGICIDGASYKNNSPTISANIITDNSAGRGGGIHCGRFSSPVISGNTISGNMADFLGGGISCYLNSSPACTNNIITKNVAAYGGGISCLNNSSPAITDNTVAENIAVHWGGGIYFSGNSSSGVSYNTITENWTWRIGGGIVCDRCRPSSPIITNNIISKNRADSIIGGIYCFRSSPIIDSCTISYNTGDGVVCDSISGPEIHFCDIVNNSGYGVRNLDSTIIVNAEYNWWGDKSGPYHPVSNPGGKGDSVSDYVDFDPWLGSPVPVEEEPSQKIAFDLKISPNPTHGPINLELPADIEQLTLFDAAGRQMKKLQPSPKLTLNLPAGIYFLQIETKTQTKTEKIIILK